MNTMSLRECIAAGYPAIVMQTAEEERAIQDCLDVADRFDKKGVFCWSCTNGIEEIQRKVWQNEEDVEIIHKTVDKDCLDARTAMEEGHTLMDKDGDYIYCLLDFHHYLEAADVLRSAKDAFKEAKELGINYVFISNTFKIPDDWEEVAITISQPLPDQEELENLLKDVVDMQRDMIVAPDKKNMGQLIKQAAKAALGLTRNQADNAFSTSIAKKQGIDLHVIGDVKSQIICKDGLLEVWNSDEAVAVGGMHTLTWYTNQRLLAYSDEAQKYGLPYPKGVLLIGIPGCGKSLAAKALASNWNVPLVRCDLGKLFGSYVGDTEANTRNALKTAEAMAPCVLWIDEIEKGLSGVGSSGKTDSGVTSRMFGSILTWMQEKKSAVYVVATANSIENLPQELLRKGRFDEIFFVDLPNEEERKEIFEIQLRNRKRDPKRFDIGALAKDSDGYTGAEIEEAVISAMYNAYSDKGREVDNEDIINVLHTMNPTSKGIMSGTVTALREWAEKSGIMNANSGPTTTTAVPELPEPKKRAGRKIIADV